MSRVTGPRTGQSARAGDWEVTLDWRDAKMGTEAVINDQISAGPWLLRECSWDRVCKEVVYRRERFLNEFMTAYGYSPFGKFAVKVRKVDHAG